MSHSQTDLNVSLEPHLYAALKPLPPLLEAPLRAQLQPYLDTRPPPKTIPFTLLSSISRWSRSPAGARALPPLDPHTYTMIALLAGTTTSPERRFPAYTPKEDREAEDRKRAVEDRKAITALVNALLSVGGCGFATWWAAERLSWRNEWRVLLALFAAVVVATSEAVLYLIWDARRKGKLERMAQLVNDRTSAAPTKAVREAPEQPVDTAAVTVTSSASPDPALRLRAVNSAGDKE